MSVSESDNETLDTFTPLPPISRTCRKRPRSSHDFFDSLICTICFEYFRPPVVLCESGHSFCLACIERMQDSLLNSRCPECRAPIDKSSRNRRLEDELEKVSIPCPWQEYGCLERISLIERETHERECEFYPETIPCLYNSSFENFICLWKGNPMRLKEHLREEHGINIIERSEVVKFLWNPPTPNVTRTRYRPLVVNYGSSKGAFLLEHCFLPREELCLFILKSLDKEKKARYKISVLNRENPENEIVFCGFTPYIKEFPMLGQYPSVDKKHFLSVPLSVIQDFCFTNPEDNTVYFSFHVTLKAPREISEQ